MLSIIGLVYLAIAALAMAREALWLPAHVRIARDFHGFSGDDWGWFALAAVGSVIATGIVWPWRLALLARGWLRILHQRRGAKETTMFTIHFTEHEKEAVALAKDDDASRLEIEALLAVEQCARMFPQEMSPGDRERVFGAFDDAKWVLDETRSKDCPVIGIRESWKARTEMRLRGVVGPITSTKTKYD